MESGEIVKESKPLWRILFVGFLLGVLASFLALVFITFKWGPRGENVEVDLYSGRTITHKSFLGKLSHAPGPMEPHVQWAIQHQDPVKSWYLVGASSQKGWFERTLCVDYTTRSYVYEIHSLKTPEEEKVKLLHQYHKELDALKLKEQEQKKYFDFMKPFYAKWDQELQKLKNDATEAISIF
jgi:hypothetical protein